MFQALITTLLIATIGTLIVPFFRKKTLSLIDDQAAAIDEEEVNLTIERQTIASSLSELELDFDQGKLPSGDYNQHKLKLEHRLLEVMDRLTQLLKVKPLKKKKQGSGKKEPEEKRGRAWFSIGMLILVMAGGSTGAYQLVQWQFEQKSFAADTRGGISAAAPIDPVKMVARLEKKLAEDPDNLQGQIMIGRSYMALERWDDAERAWTKVLELDPRNYTAHYRLGEILLSNPKMGTSEEAEVALEHFEKALVSVPQDASILWAKGIVLLQLGRIAAADETWAEAFQYIPAGSESSEMVKKALQDLRSGKMPTPQ